MFNSFASHALDQTNTSGKWLSSGSMLSSQVFHIKDLFLPSQSPSLFFAHVHLYSTFSFLFIRYIYHSLELLRRGFSYEDFIIRVANVLNSLAVNPETGTGIH